MGNDISLIVCKVLFSLVPRPAVSGLGTRLGTVVLQVKAELTVLRTQVLDSVVSVSHHYTGLGYYRAINHTDLYYDQLNMMSELYEYQPIVATYPTISTCRVLPPTQASWTGTRRPLPSWRWRVKPGTARDSGSRRRVGRGLETEPYRT